MKVLLIYPGLVEGFGSYRRGADWFNHGLGIISSLLKSHGHEIQYIDCRKLGGWKELRTGISASSFDIAMISVASVDLDPARRIARMVKEKGPNIPVMVGGPHPTLMTEETAQFGEFDYLFTHEAEVTLPSLLKRLAEIPRINRGEMPPDLDLLPFVDRSLAPEGETSWFAGLEQPYFSITASRGCLYNCTFCQPAERIVFGNKVRKRSVDNILNELEDLVKRYRMRSFMIHDDCFTQYRRWAEEFSAGKQRRNLDQPFACQTRADIVCRQPDLIRSLYDAGLRWVLIGFESGSDRILKLLKKGVTVEQNLQAAEICKSLGIRILANYMFGIPTETREEMDATLAMVRKIDPAIHSPAVFTPAPGSELYRHCVENNLLIMTNSRSYQRDALSGRKIRNVDYRYIDLLVHRLMHGEVRGRLLYHLYYNPIGRLGLKSRAIMLKNKLVGNA